VIVIDERIARRFWPDADPVGRRMWYPSDPRLLPPTDDSQFLTIVGVVNSVRMRSMSGEGERLGSVYRPMTQSASRTLTITARTQVAPAALTAAIRSLVKELDAELPLSNVRTMTERRDLVMQTRRTPMVLSAIFGVVRAVPGGGRPVRGAGLPGGAAAARDRYPYGSRREHGSHSAARAP